MAPGKPAKSGNRTQLYNIVTAVMLGLTAVTCCTVAVLGATSAGAVSPQQAAVPTLFVLPTFTQTLAGPTTGPTATGTATPTITATATVTAMPTVTDTPTPTDTPVGPTATDTPLPTGTSRPTATRTPPPFPYVLRNDEVIYTANFANTAGCDWSGIAGLVYDQNGQHQLAVTVHVTGPNLDETRVSGSKTEYGGSGWEVYITNKPVDGLYTVQLLDSTGKPISDKVSVQMVPDCKSNLAMVVFDEVK
jgi:hypothetical protein